MELASGYRFLSDLSKDSGHGTISQFFDAIESLKRFSRPWRPVCVNVSPGRCAAT